MFNFFLFLKLIPEIISIIVFALILIWAIRTFIADSIKQRILQRNGFAYDFGLGYRCEYQHQPHWVRGEERVHWKTVSLGTIGEVKKICQKEI